MKRTNRKQTKLLMGKFTKYTVSSYTYDNVTTYEVGVLTYNGEDMRKFNKLADVLEFLKNALSQGITNA